MYDLIVVGSGAAGMMSAIIAARDNKQVLLLEKMDSLGVKLKSTGGGKCNITNTLSNEDFMSRFGKDAHFMKYAMDMLDSFSLREFLEKIGIETKTRDGFRVFPASHNSGTIIKGLVDELIRLNVEIKCNQKVKNILVEDKKICAIETNTDNFQTNNIILATGGLGFPNMGATGDGFTMVEKLGHKITDLFPGMMPLQTKEEWVGECKADTMAKVELKVDLKKERKLKAKGDLIFTKDGIRGPVVLDFAREVTPLLDKYKEVPLLLNFTKGMNEDDINNHFKKEMTKNPDFSTVELLQTLLPKSLSIEILKLVNADEKIGLKHQKGIIKDALIKILAWTPLTVTGHDGFKKAMITRGGVSLKEIDSKTMQSKLIDGLYFCGEIMNIDGPCGGYNLQWSFASGYLAGHLKGKN